MAKHLRAALIALALALGIVSGAIHAAAAPVKTSSDWGHLTPAQREILAPFGQDWDHFTEVRKLKWLGIADRYPKMTPPEQANVRARMQEWAQLTPQDREKAREQYKKLRTAPSAERRQLEQKWREYDALPSEQKQALKAAPRIPPSASGAASPSALTQGARPPKPVVVAPRTVKPSRKTPLPASAQSAPSSQSEPAKTSP